MARYLFCHCGSPPVVTPDLPSTDAVEAWAGRTYLYATDEGWRDIPADIAMDLGLPNSSGDPDVDWPVRRSLCEEDWYVGPLTVLS